MDLKLTVNGAKHDHRGRGTAAALFRELGVDGRRVALVVNGDIVNRACRGKVRLKSGDSVEILTYAGGG